MSQCVNTVPVAVCFTAADGTRTTILEHVIYEKGSPIGVGYTTYDDPETIFDISTGTVTPGACPVFAPDVEWTTLCDVQADGSVVEFMCRVVTPFDANGNVDEANVTVTNFEMDKTTAYTPTGTVEEDCGCVPKGSLGVITNWTDLN